MRNPGLLSFLNIGKILRRPPRRGDRQLTADLRSQLVTLAVLDEDGYLFLDGRREDLIITGGMNVYPAHVEAVLSAVDGVAEIAVFGVDDDLWGQRVCAAVVGSASDEAINAAGTAHLAGYQRPKVIYRLTELPATRWGKFSDLNSRDISR